MTADRVAHLRHELRTPLNHVVGYSELLLEDAVARWPELTGELERIHAAAREAATVITERLPASLTTAGDADLTALAAAAAPAVETMTSSAARLTELAASMGDAKLSDDIRKIAESTRDFHALLAAGVPAPGSPRTTLPASVGTPVTPAAPGRGVILVVDDDADNRETLGRRLVREGYTVREAASGREALRLLAAEPVDLALLDVVMPDLDGIDVLRSLKADERLRHIPVLMISAHGETAHVVRSIELGADDYLPKPFDPVLLRARITSCLEKKRLRDAERRHLAELAELNRTLETRVADKVAELERVGRLTRFVPLQLAELIAAGGAEDPLRPHRREIVVVILDIRGFGQFLETAEPEEVMALLREYHGEMGRLVLVHQGTLERFSGDSIIVLFNDPVEMPDPAARAVQMAVAMRNRFAELAGRWRRRGWVMRLAIGIGQGFATIGEIGFEGRRDYGAMGRVMGITDALCAAADEGQILVTGKVAAGVEHVAETIPMSGVALRGVARPVPVFNVAGLRIC